MSKRYGIFFRTTFSAVADGVIAGVAVISEGPALGHDVDVDATTLAQVKACAESYTGGVKVKADHFGGFRDIVGFLKSFRVDGTKLLADLHLLKSSPLAAFVAEVAEKIPDSVGLSIFFEGLPEQVGDRIYARCAKLFSADLVTEPAANSGGLFEAKPGDTGTECMTPEQLAALNKSIEALTARIAKLEGAKPAPAADEDPKKADEALSQFSTKLGAQVETALVEFRNKALETLTSFGLKPGAAAPAAAPAAPAQPKQEDMTFVQLFEAALNDATNAKKTDAEVLRAAMNAHPAKYQAALAAGGFKSLPKRKAA